MAHTLIKMEYVYELRHNFKNIYKINKPIVENNQIDYNKTTSELIGIYDSIDKARKGGIKFYESKYPYYTLDIYIVKVNKDVLTGDGKFEKIELFIDENMKKISEKKRNNFIQYH